MYFINKTYNDRPSGAVLSFKICDTKVDNIDDYTLVKPRS